MARQFFDGQSAGPMPLQAGLPFQAPRLPIDALQRGASPRVGTPAETGNAAFSDAWARGATPSSNALADAWNRGATSSQAPIAAEPVHGRLGNPGMPLGMGMYGEFPVPDLRNR